MSSLSLSGEASALSSLPADIGRLIFEHIAEAGDTVACALVSREVQKWTEPIIYRNVVLHHPEKARLFLRTVTTFTANPASRKSPTFFASYVKGLCIHRFHVDDLDEDEICTILRACPSISAMSWALWAFPEGEHESDFISPTRLRVQRLAGICCKQAIPGKLLERTTHLDLETCRTFPDEWEALAALPHLTHLAIGLRRSKSLGIQVAAVTRVFFPHSTTLRVLLFVDHPLIITDELDGVPEVWAIDDRAVLAMTDDDSRQSILSRLTPGQEKEILKLGTRAEYASQWKSVDTVGLGYWICAEAFIEERRRRRLESAMEAHSDSY